jgi:ribosomal protein S18 acetylase RimI-like enzyme
MVANTSIVTVSSSFTPAPWWNRMSHHPVANMNAVDEGPGYPVPVGSKAVELANTDEAEVLAFLNEQPLRTFGLVGFIRSNGLVSPHNRGVFYGARDSEGRLEGVALVGHATVFEARTQNAIRVLAGCAHGVNETHLLLGEEHQMNLFWKYYAASDRVPRLRYTEHLLVQNWPVAVRDRVSDLRLATRPDLDLVVPTHARTAFEESGVNPLDSDPAGFRERCGRRIDNGKTWVWIRDGRLIFTAEVVSDAPEVVYVEGVDVNPADRGQGYGLRCLSQLTRILLERTKSVCVLVNDGNPRAQAFYRKAGFAPHGRFTSVFF